MATNSEKSRDDKSSEFSDEAIRRFLLGRLSLSEQPAFERQLFSDSRLDARVRLAELDLADDYTYGRLDRDERQFVEETFLVTSDRRRRLEVSMVLRDRFASASVTKTRTAFIAQVGSLLRLNRPAWRYTFALLIFMLLVGTAWVVVKKEGRIKEEIKRMAQRRSSAPVMPVESSHPTNNSLPEHQTSPSPMPVHDQTLPAIVSIILTPAGSFGAGIASFHLPEDGQAIVRLQLALRSNQPGPYRAELLTVDEQSVFNAESIKSHDNGGALLDFDVPARLLKTGNYQVRVARDNAGVKENVGRYFFRVD